MSESDEILYEVSNRVARITINRPQARNALNADIIESLDAIIGRAGQDREVGAVVISGAGGRAFCAGVDLADSFSPDKPILDQHEARGGLARVFLKMNQCRKPILGAVEGYCLAGGVGLCLSCDLVIASDDSRFGLPEIKRGLWPYMVSTLLIRNVGLKKALEFCMTGEYVSAAQAEAMGLINYSVPKAEFKDRVTEMAKTLASFSPAVMGLGKTSFYRVADMEMSAAFEFLKSQLTINARTEDIQEGISAFFEKREPEWKGR